MHFVDSHAHLTSDGNREKLLKKLSLMPIGPMFALLLTFALIQAP